MAALKCRDGDFAVVINDTIDCRQNLGRIVRLRGPVRLLKPSGMLGWRINHYTQSLGASQKSMDEASTSW